MEYKGKKQYKVEHNWNSEIYTVVEVDFDFPNVLEMMKEMVEFWSGWENRLGWNDGDYVKTFLQQVASWCWTPRLQYNPWGVRTYFDDREGWVPLDGSNGINILQSETISIEDEDFDVTETEGVTPYPSPFEKIS